MRIIYETEQLRIANEYEIAYLIDKLKGEIIFQDRFLGDPTCGYINEENTWGAIGGSHLIFWTKNKIKKYPRNIICHIHEMREKGGKLEILTDPWENKCAIWNIEVETGKLERTREFQFYLDKKYTENVIW